MSSDDRSKLKTLLNYWVEHNEEHAGEFKEWAERARQMGEDEVAGELLEAVGNMERVNQILAGILKRLEV